MDNEAYYEEILAAAETEGYAATYARLRGAVDGGQCEITPLCCYYLACLAGGSGEGGSALFWLEQAIRERGWWYRPEVLEDEDLSLLEGNAAFAALLQTSRARWQAAAATARAEESWHEKTAESVLLAVHGNTQSALQARQNWEMVTAKLQGWQVETVLSHTVDGFGTRRWDYDLENYKDAAAAAAHLAAAGYAYTAWGGFSAGCDILLRTALFTPLRCDAVLLQSPWLPLTENADARAAVCRALREKNMRLTLFCGAEDSDCMACAELLYETARAQGVNATLTRQSGLRHCFPQKATQPLRAVLGALEADK